MPRRILIVEDEPDFQELLRYHLAGPDCELVVAGNFAAAIAAAARTPPDLILLDIMLPDVDGLSLCEVLRTQPALLPAPVWIISAAHSVPIRQIAREVGASEFFSKPVDLAALKSRFQTWLALPPAGAASAA